MSHPLFNGLDLTLISEIADKVTAFIDAAAALAEHQLAHDDRYDARDLAAGMLKAHLDYCAKAIPHPHTDEDQDDLLTDRACDYLRNRVLKARGALQ
ncbi:hypothetical protein K9B35_14405 [Sphingomonas sp. R647]|uniref:hypothetical protein n=1 Tax=Sphingomonas sp. R647 TaxID=2875233 RepID=UPI001CD38600|nr:hypothetical protein [Sphingomonas sp. R647]MCA1199166.1 hypothetical protein [Sphingomonas sp. R647]